MTTKQKIAKSEKLRRIATGMLLTGIVLFIVMLYSIMGAFAAIGSGNEDTNVVKVSPNFSDTSKPNQDGYTSGEVNVFSIQYSGTSGEITVRSELGDKVVAPGTEDTGEFKVKNTSSNKIDCECEFYSVNKDKIPVRVKLLDQNKKYLVGSATSYADPDNLNTITKNYEMIPGEVVTFSLPWKWLFEEFDKDGHILDKRDTEDFGNRAVDEDIVIEVGIKTKATVIPEGGGSGTSQTNDNIPIILVLALAILLVLAAIALYIYSRKKKADEIKAANAAAHINNDKNKNEVNTKVDEQKQ